MPNANPIISAAALFAGPSWIYQDEEHTPLSVVARWLSQARAEEESPPSEAHWLALATLAESALTSGSVEPVAWCSQTELNILLDAITHPGGSELQTSAQDDSRVGSALRRLVG